MGGESETPRAMLEFVHGGPTSDIAADISFLLKRVRELSVAQTGGGNTEVVGVIKGFGGAVAPTGYLLCDGTSYLRTDYPDLFTAIGTAYGAADATHFNVPDLRGRVPIGVGTGIGGGASGVGLPAGGAALTAVARGTWKGEETHVLTLAELAQHNHVVTFYFAGGGGNISGAQSTGATGTVNTGNAGSNNAHNNIQPEMGINFIIKT